MPSLYDYKKEDYAAMLAFSELDASGGVLYRTTDLEPDDTNRTIFIGLGGAGVQTIDAIKGAVMKRMDKSWRRYIGFLGIDSDWTEFDHIAYLDRSEQVIITKKNVAARMSSPSTFPYAVRRFVPKEGRLRNLEHCGANCTRLIGKVKIHDCKPGGPGVDEEIVHALSNLAQHLDRIVDGQGRYQIYVIGSVCGGTCSGSFLEMPALIRKAFNNSDRLSINAMLYLPDTMTALDPQFQSRLYANGYAALKELNYYMGMFMRPEYPETWSYNGQADGYQLTHKYSIMEEGLFRIPYLIGTTSGPNAEAMGLSREAVAEFLAYMLLKWPSDIISLTNIFDGRMRSAGIVGNKPTDPADRYKEAPGEFHEFPKRFSTIGYARAAIPEKLIRAYTVSKLCELACIKPGESPVCDIKPWRGMMDLMSATEGTARAEKLLQPLKSVMELICRSDFTLAKFVGIADVTWKKIHDGEYDTDSFRMQTESVIHSCTASEAVDTLKNKICAAYSDFRKNVHRFVREEGPCAFVILYEGRFSPVGDNFGLGIAQMLNNLLDGRSLDGKPIFGRITEKAARAELQRIRQEIGDTSALNPFLNTRRMNQAECWTDAFNNWCRTRINDCFRGIALGPNGLLHDCFRMPAAKLSAELESFGNLLATMRDIYSYHALSLNSYSNFCRDGNMGTEINMAGAFVPGYTWVLDQADAAMDNADPQKFRDALVDDFFGFDDTGTPNSTLWLDVPNEMVAINPVTRKIRLTVPDRAVPGRWRFDRIVAEVFPDTVNISIEDLFVQLSSAGFSFQTTASRLISQLYARSKPLFNGDIPSESLYGFLAIPRDLINGSTAGQEIAHALKQAARAICPNMQWFDCEDSDSIRFYQLAGPMEVYRLRELKLWESHYEQGPNGIQNHGSGLHSMSQDVEPHFTDRGWIDHYIEGIPWADYPPIVPTGRDERKPDENGVISREGQYLLEMDKVIAKARELGVLYSEQSRHGWVIKRVFCNTVTDTWEFSVEMCHPDPETGFLPFGKALAEAVAEQNGKSLEDISRRVRLEYGGLMDAEYPTEELAWQYAARVLRHHMPMYIEVRKTLKLFEGWAKDIDAYNKIILESHQPAKMVYMLRGGTLRRDEDGRWCYEDTTGCVRLLLNTLFVDFLEPKDRYMIKNGLLYYYLYRKLNNIMGHSADAWDAALDYAKHQFNALVMNNNMTALEASQGLLAELEAERVALGEKGARLDGDATAQPKIAFVQNMGNMFTIEELTEIDLFYYRASLWEKL